MSDGSPNVLSECPACKHTVSTDATKCPECGHPLPKSQKNYTILIGLLFLIGSYWIAHEEGRFTATAIFVGICGATLIILVKFGKFAGK
jgi:hypothetical protein